MIIVQLQVSLLKSLFTFDTIKKIFLKGIACMKTSFRLFFSLILFNLIFMTVSAQETIPKNENTDTSQTVSNTKKYRYDLGSQIYSFQAGPFFPLFIYTFDNDTITTGKMGVGGYANMSWDAFYNKDISIGAEIGYAFSYAVNDILYTAIPVVFNAKYYLSQGNFDLPIGVGAGLIYNSYDEKNYFGTVLKADIGSIFNFNENWGIGLHLNYWLIPEIYFGSNANNNALGNQLTSSLSLQYTK